MLVNQEKVRLNLVGLDGNLFSLMGTFSADARRQGWPQEDIKTVLDKCREGTYDEFLCVLMDHTTTEEEDEEDL